LDTSKTKANPDYSASALKLAILPEFPSVIPPDVWAQQNRLATLSAFTVQLSEAVVKLGETPQAVALKAAQEALDATPESQTVRAIQEATVKLKADIAEKMSDFGYQDVERGWYALYQRRVTPVYAAELVKVNLPKFAPVIIEEAVNVKALEGLIKGKLITEEDAKKCIGEVKEVLVPIIKAGS
jgi:hypothetical protein